MAIKIDKKLYKLNSVLILMKFKTMHKLLSKKIDNYKIMYSIF